MESPFQLARRIPKDTWKTVTDAWNGYHSVPLRDSDRHLTIFITPFGCWRYTRAPQGFLSSGDRYNRHFDAVLPEFERKECCVNDTVHYDTDLEQHWWRRTIDFLTRVGRAGIVLNPDKFQFAERSVDFAGFRVSDSTIEPLPKYLDAIKDFPSPTSTTDIRSWFGLVNQVSNYAQLRDSMASFKPFLSPRCKFLWSPELESTFQASKEAIIKAIRQGVEIFDIQRHTCLRPDWSKRGISYFLLQQHCSCPSGVPDCCPGGWRITLAGSRFLNSAEQRYAAIEGEALAVVWGLEQTRYFTQVTSVTRPPYVHSSQQLHNFKLNALGPRTGGDEGTTAGQPLAIYQQLGRTGDEWRVGHVVLKTLELVSHGRINLIVLIIVSSLFFIAFSFIVLVIQRIYTVFHPVELFHRCN